MRGRGLLWLSLLLVVLSTKVWGQGEMVVDFQLQAYSVGVRSVAIEWNGPSHLGAPELFRRRLPDGEWYSRGVMNGGLWVDSLGFTPCLDSMAYRLMLNVSDTIHCSNVVGLLMNDTVPTSPCELDVVTVLQPSQEVELRWKPSPDVDVMGYLVCMGSPCLSTDTIYGRFNTRLTTDLSPLEEHRFRIYAFDSCLTASPLTEYVGNIVLRMTTERCEGRVNLSWNEYVEMPNSLHHYSIEASIDGQPYRTIATVGAQEPRVYEWVAPVEAKRVALVVVAHDEAEQYAAFSNCCEATFGTSDTAQYLSIQDLMIAPEDECVRIGLCVDPDYLMAPYVLYRSREGSSESAIAQLRPEGSSVICFEDRGIDLRNSAYGYRIGVVDGCGRNEKKSASLSTIHLSMDDGQGVHLRWNSPNGSDNQLYTVLRWGNDPAEAVVVGSTYSTEWEDVDIEQNALTEGMHYRVLSTSPSQSFCGGVDSCVSNEVHYIRPATCWVPNTIVSGDGVNGKFCVSWSMIDVNDYSLTIFDRVGREVFATNDPDDCWDGSHEGTFLPQGVYVYRIFVHHLDGQSRVLTGTVMLLR